MSVLRQVVIFAVILSALSLPAQPAIECNNDCAFADPPILSDGSYQVQQVIEVEGKTSSELYGYTKEWFASNYHSANDVIQSDDSDNYVLVGRAWTELQVTVMGITAHPKLWYSLKVEAKEGRARYTIYNMEYDGSSSMATYRAPLSQAFFEDRYRKGKKLNNRDEQLRRSWIDNINSLAESIEKALQADLSSEEDW